jgi:hypothetical protein
MTHRRGRRYLHPRHHSRSATVTQLRIGFLFAVLVSPIAVCGQLPASGASSPADVLYAQPGQLVDVGGFRLNLYCRGTGSPTVVFDSGYEDWAPAWSTIQPKITKWTRACSYDRAGAGFSDPGPMPRTSVRIAKELHTCPASRRHRWALHFGGQRLWWRQRAHFCGPVHGRGCGYGHG